MEDYLKTPISKINNAVGLFINAEGGYPSTLGGGWHMVAVTSPDEARQAVNRLIDAGADVIKTAEINITARRLQSPRMPSASRKALRASLQSRADLSPLLGVK